MKKFTFSALFIATILFSLRSQAQWINVLSENCDGASAPALPAGWTSIPADTTGWVTDATGTNASTGYANASGLSNIVVTNNSSVGGIKDLTLPAFATTNFDSVTLVWGARLTKHYMDNGSTIGLKYSTDGTNWTDLSYTENTNDSNWYLENAGKPVYLPADALNKGNVLLRFEANIVPNPSGTYRIDDIQISGHKLPTHVSSISNTTVKGFYDASAHTLTVTPSAGVNAVVTVCNVLGQPVMEKKSIDGKTSFNLSNLADGVYFLSVYSSSNGNIITSRFNKY